MGRGRRPKASQQRAWKRVVSSSKKNLSMIERLSIKRGWDSDKRVDNLLRQQRDKYEEIFDFYRTRRYGYLDRQGKDRMVLVPCVGSLGEKFKNIPQKARLIIKGMIKKALTEFEGYKNLKKLERTGVFRIVTFDITSSKGTKRHKQEKNRKKDRKNPEPILVVETGETEAAILQKLRKIENTT